MFSYTYSHEYRDGRLTRVWAELYVHGRWADVLGCGSTEEEARESALARWHRIPFDIITITGD